jgi:mRNA interferase MazF
MAKPRRSEIWRVDFGIAGKVRPALIVSADLSDNDYALIAVIPHTTAVRGSTFEVNLDLPFLRNGVFNVQGLTPLSPVRFLNRMGSATDDQMNRVSDAIDQWLCLQ